VKTKLLAPFPWFGGKSKVSDIVWERFGNVPNYVEPFFGSGAVLLNRPHEPHTETVNDLDCMVANFWRALQHDPDAVAMHADNPVNEADQHARHLWLCSQEEFRERMKVDPEYYDVKIAGWWLWGQCIWIGSGWCSAQLPHLGTAGKGLDRQRPHLGDAGKGLDRQRPHLGDAGKGLNRQLPHLGDAGTGVHRKRPHLGDAGTGVHRQRPHLGNAGTGVLCVSDLTSGTRSHESILGYMRALAERLRRVRVCCGDWSRVCGPSPTFKHGITGVFLDPPYADEAYRRSDLYASDDGQIAHAVRAWALDNGDNPFLRIALCGYEGEHAMPDSWECIAWKARGGYGSQGNGAGRENAGRERIWFSPHCLRQPGLF
jgi:D12 class N6 adenine-specific DNA methyltransferase